MDDREVLSRLAAPLDGWTVGVIGLGGIGTHVSQAVAQFLAYGRPETTLYLCDGDDYVEKNRSRTLFQEAGNKALVRAGELTAALAGAPAIVPVPRYVTPRNARGLIPERSLTFVCVDNHATRNVIGRSVARRKMRDVVLISGGNDGVEDGLAGTYGNVIVHARREGRDLTNPIATFHPEIARPKDKPPGAPGCAVQAPSAPQLLITNFAVASAMLMAFYAWLTSQLSFEELYLDVAQARVRPVCRKVRA